MEILPLIYIALVVILLYLIFRYYSGAGCLKKIEKGHLESLFLIMLSSVLYWLGIMKLNNHPDEPKYGRNEMVALMFALLSGIVVFGQLLYNIGD